MTSTPYCLVGAAATSPQISGTSTSVATRQTKRSLSHFRGVILPIVEIGDRNGDMFLVAVMV